MSKNKSEAGEADVVINGEVEEVYFTATSKVYYVFNDEYAEKVRDAAQTLLRAGATAQSIASMVQHILEEADYDCTVDVEEDEEYDIYYLYIVYPLAVEFFFQAASQAAEEIA